MHNKTCLEQLFTAMVMILLEASICRQACKGGLRTNPKELLRRTTRAKAKPRPPQPPGLPPQPKALPKAQVSDPPYAPPPPPLDPNIC